MSTVGPKIAADKFVNTLRRVGYLSPIISKETGKTQVAGILYGPLGCLFKNNILQEWWKSVTTRADENIFAISVPLTNLENGEGKQIRSSLHSSTLQEFDNVVRLVGGKLPFGIAHSGKCISKSDPDNKKDDLLFRFPRERTDLTVQFFCSPLSSNHWFHHWQRNRFLWWRKFAGVPSSFSMTETMTENGEQFVHVIFENALGSVIVETIKNRGSQPLTTENGNQYQVKDGRKTVTPHVIECHSCLDGAVSTYLTDAFHLNSTDQSKIVFRIHPILAPYKVCLASSASSSSQIRELINYLVREIRRANVQVINFPDTTEHTSLDAQFSRSDEMGIPYSVVVNDASVRSGVVNLRNRDTTLKEQVHVAELVEKLQKYLLWLKIQRELYLI